MEAAFSRIVEYARANNPFYSEWLRTPGVIPILDRRTLLANNDRILNGHPVTATTSGSTGVPVRISMAPERAAKGKEHTALFVQWLGGPMRRSAIVHVSGGDEPGKLSVQAPIDEQIAFLIRRYKEGEAVAFTTYPTNAMLLGQAILDGGHDLSFIRRLGLISESFEPWQRTFLREAFPNAHIWTTYSSMEVGMISGQCPYESEFQHIMTDTLGIEVLNDNDQPCPDGQVGRIILTDYLNLRSPLIRYEIGDLAIKARCPCRRIDLPAFSKVHGKIRGTLRHRSGQRVFFSALSVALRDLPGMKQYQVIQEELERFTVRLVCDRDLQEPIAAAFEAHFGYRPDLHFEMCESLARDPNGKFYASICKLGN